MAGAMRVDDDNLVVNASHMILPCFPNAGLSPQGVFNANIRIPIDDSHENHFRLRWTRRGFTDKELYDFKYGGFIFPLHEAGTYRADKRIDNDYGHDPVLQRQFNFSGVTTFPTQDLMMIENQWGPIADRTKEHLVASDREIIGVRRRLLKMAKALADGIEPEEPFLMKNSRQEHPDTFVVPAKKRLDDAEMERIVSGLNTTLLKTEGSDAAVMWGPSVESDPAGTGETVTTTS